jgi:hypothetical protein
MTHRQRLILVVSAMSLAACAWMPEVKFWDKGYDFVPASVKVWELRRALLCGTPTEDAVVRLFDSAEALQAWDADDMLQLQRIELPAEKAFVLLEQGLRSTGGYSVEMNRVAQLDDQGVLTLQAEWLEPAPDRMVTQMMTSLCVLAAVDAVPYARVEVRDANAHLKAFFNPQRD